MADPSSGPPATEAPEYGKDGIVCDGSGCHTDVSPASEFEANADQKSAGRAGGFALSWTAQCSFTLTFVAGLTPRLWTRT